MIPPASPAPLNLRPDEELVYASIRGDREAFREIVERYQRLLCSVAYSATGQLSQSEDLAQETFLEAWRSLPQLREPHKLKAWLCGILRFKVSRLRRSEHNEPVRNAEGIEAAESVTTDEAPAHAEAAKKEEQAILWSALERVPELYREPLILFYREHRSIEHVASALDLTEDTVKQRLARGRKLLQEQVLAFVEGALSRSSPGSLFTSGVLAALPAVSTPMKAAGIGAAAAKASAVAKSTSIAALLASVTGLINAVLALRANLDQARTPRERRAVVKMTLWFFFGSLAYLGGLYAMRELPRAGWMNPWSAAVICQALVIAGMIAFPFAISRVAAAQRRLRTEERRAHPEAFSAAIDELGSAAGEYCTRTRLFGLPLIRVRLAAAEENQPPVVAWIAAGDRAYGVLAAWGGFTVAPISVGAVAIGGLAIGSFSVGVVSLGTFAVGITALGCATIGLKAYAWLSALGWKAAGSGGFAIAHTAAEGLFAWAQHANDAIAHAIVSGPEAGRNTFLFYVLIGVFGIIPVALYARAVRERLGSKARSGR